MVTQSGDIIGQSKVECFASSSLENYLVFISLIQLVYCLTITHKRSAVFVKARGLFLLSFFVIASLCSFLCYSWFHFVSWILMLLQTMKQGHTKMKVVFVSDTCQTRFVWRDSTRLTRQTRSNESWTWCPTRLTRSWSTQLDLVKKNTKPWCRRRRLDLVKKKTKTWCHRLLDLVKKKTLPWCCRRRLDLAVIIWISW